jgi:protein tyrosine/serine phosphatase
MLDYGIMRTASNQEELIEAIKDALAYPEKYAQERRRVVEKELGPLDGKAISRLVEACWEIFQAQKGKEKSDSIPYH